MQREIAVASDEAARDYYENTIKELQTPQGVWEVMSTAATKLVEGIKKKDFDKYLSVANPRNGEDFMDEVQFFCIIFNFIS
jgi:mannose/fructose/N-acetylgalactosamine-specific phosphotransferase system component IIB